MPARMQQRRPAVAPQLVIRRMLPLLNKLLGVCIRKRRYGVGLSESGQADWRLRAGCPTGAKKTALACASIQASCQQRDRDEEKEREREGEKPRGGMGAAVFLIPLIFTPALGGGKCQALIELIKLFWVSDINIVSTTKGHLTPIPPPPRTQAWSRTKGLPVVYLHMQVIHNPPHLCRWHSMVWDWI